MTTYAPPAPPPPKRERSRRYVAWAVFLFFVPPLVAGTGFVVATAHYYQDYQWLEAEGPVQLEQTTYSFATRASQPGRQPCRLVSRADGSRQVTALEDRFDYPMTYQDRRFRHRGAFTITEPGRYRVVCPGADPLVLLQYSSLPSWAVWLLPLGLLAGIGQLVAVVMFFRMRRQA